MATFENSTIVKYCLQYPVVIASVVITALISLIMADQLLNGMAASEMEEGVVTTFNSFNGTFVGWSSTTPEIISYFKDTHEPSTGVFTPECLVSYKNSIQTMLHFIEAQARLISSFLR